MASPYVNVEYGDAKKKEITERTELEKGSCVSGKPVSSLDLVTAPRADVPITATDVINVTFD